MRHECTYIMYTRAPWSQTRLLARSHALTPSSATHRRLARQTITFRVLLHAHVFEFCSWKLTSFVPPKLCGKRRNTSRSFAVSPLVAAEISSCSYIVNAKNEILSKIWPEPCSLELPAWSSSSRAPSSCVCVNRPASIASPSLRCSTRQRCPAVQLAASLQSEL